MTKPGRLTDLTSDLQNFPRVGVYRKVCKPDVRSVRIEGASNGHTLPYTPVDTLLGTAERLVADPFLAGERRAERPALAGLPRQRHP